MRFITRAIIGLVFLSAATLVKAQFIYTNVNGSVTITGYSGPGGAVTFPASIGGLPVTALGTQVFFLNHTVNYTVASVSIPASITNIQSGAFSYAFGLTAITVNPANPVFSSVGGVLFDQSRSTLLAFPGGVTGAYTIPAGVTAIGDDAFFVSLLTTVNIPSSVASIGITAFGSCPLLTQLNIDPANRAFASVDGVLYDFTQTTLLQYPGGLPGPFAIPPTVVNIGSSSFQSAYGLTSVYLPPSVAGIGSQAFSGCSSLQSFNVDPANLVYSSLNGVLFDMARDTLLIFPGGLGGNYAIPNGVTTIADGAFNKARVTGVAIPASTTDLSSQPFYNCSSLLSISVDPVNSVYSSLNGVLFDKNQVTLILYPAGLTGSFTIPTSVTTVGTFAFLFSQLSHVTFPASVSSLQDYALADCANLASATFLGNPPAMDSTVFYGDPNAVLYYLPGASGWSTPFNGVPTLLWNAVVYAGPNSPGIQNQQFGFKVTGTAGLAVVVQGSTNLASPVWLPLQALTLTNGSAYFSEPVNADVPASFFRLSTP